MHSESIEPGESVSIEITAESAIICSSQCVCGDLVLPVNAPLIITPHAGGPITLAIKNVTEVGCTVEVHPAPAMQKIEVDQSVPDIVATEEPTQE